MSKFLILDRDGTINEDKGYVYKIEDLVILPGVLEGLKKFKDAGWKFVIVTNQSGIARKFYTVNDMHRFHREIRFELAKEGIEIEAFAHCPHHPEINGNCHCRKPKTKLVEDLASRLGFSPQNCIFMGDKDSDIELGLKLGGTTVLINNWQYINSIKPDIEARDISHAFDLLKEQNRV